MSTWSSEKKTEKQRRNNEKTRKQEKTKNIKTEVAKGEKSWIT